MEILIIKTLEFLGGQSLQVAIVFTAVLILTWLLRNKSAHVRYLLWLLVAIKCLTPPLVIFSVPVLPADPVSVVMPAQPMEMNYQQTKNTVITIKPDEAQSQAPIENLSPGDQQSKIENSPIARLHLTSTGVLLSAWAAGAAFYLLWALGKAVRLGMRLKQIRRPLPPKLVIEQIEMLTRLWDYPGGFKVWLVDGINQPFVWGLWRGAIYLPTRFQSIQGDKQKAIVLHEMAHVVRLDAFVNLIQILIQGVFWFHPLVWLANKAIRQEREKCCDEIAVARLGTAPKEYGSAIVDTLLQEAQSSMAIPTLAVAGPVKNIEDRIKTIMQPGKRFFRRPSMIALMIIGLLALVTIPTTIALTQKPTPPDYTLSGTVLDATTEKPIAGAIVYDNGYGPQPYQKGITDDNGKFEYKSWNEEHNVAAKVDGYQQQTVTFTTFPLDNSKNLNFKLQKSSTPENAKINVVLRTISIPNDKAQIQSLFDKAEINIPRFEMFVSQNNPDKQASGEVTYGHTFLTAQDVEKLLKAVQSSPDAKLLTSPRLEINSGQSSIIQVQTERTAPEKKFLLHITPSLTTDGILSQFTVISTDSVNTDRPQATQTTHIRSIIVIPQDKTLLILGPDYYQESMGVQPAGPKPKGRMLILMETSRQPQAESIQPAPDFKKRYFITIVANKNNDISGPGQKVTLEQLEAMMRHYPDPAHTVLEVAFEPGAFPDIHTQYKDNPVFLQAGQLVEKYKLEYLSYVGEDRPENRRGPISIRTEDALVMDKTIPVGMSAIGLNSDKPFLTVNSIQFSNKDFHFIADLQMSVISLPQRHWEIKVRLLDKDDKQLESVMNYYQNSKSNPFLSDQTLRFDLGKEDLSQAAKFEIEVRLLTPNAERLDVYLVRQAAVACVHFAGKNGGQLPEKLEQIQSYLETEILLPLDKMEFLQAGRKMSEIKDVAATALLRMQLNDGKDGVILAFCDGHVEYFSPERMKTQDYPDVPLRSGQKTEVKIETTKQIPQFATTPPIGVNANPQDANQPMDRTLYFKLPLAQPQFHWKFTNKDLYLSGKLVLRIIRDEQINEIVVFNKGEITKGWGVIRSESGPQDNAIYFGFYSTTKYSTTPNDKVDLEFIAKEDLDGIGRLQTGVLKAGTHKALGNLKIYSTDSDTAYIEWQDKWLLDITSEEGWMTSKQGLFINDKGALRPLTRAEKKRICAGANWGNRNFFGHCDISLMEYIETKNDNENHFRKIRIRKGVIKTHIDITEFADKRQEQVQSKTSLVSERDSSGYFTQRFDHSSKKVFLEDGTLNGDYSIFEFGRIDPKIAITIGILCYLFDNDNQVEQFENATIFSDTAEVDQFQLINLKDNSILYTLELNKMDWGLCRKIQWYNKGSNTLSKSIEYADFNRPVEFKTLADPGDSGYLLPYKTVRRYFDNEGNEERTEKLEIIDAAMVSNEKKLNYFVLQQNYGNDFNFETPHDYMIIDRRSQGGQEQSKVSGEIQTPDYPDVPLRSGQKTDVKTDTDTTKSYIPSTSRIDQTGRIVDKLDFPFVNDPDVIGTWQSVDFVNEPVEFQPGQNQGKSSKLYLKELVILPNGRMLQPWWTWTKGLIFQSDNKTASRYIFKEINGTQYMFFEWKSGDYSIRHQKPSWYVLKKNPLDTAQPTDSPAPLSLSTPNDSAAVEILKKTQALYEGLTSYSSEGEVITDMDMSEVDVNTVYGLTKDVSKELQKTQEGQNILKKHPSFKNTFSIRLTRPLYYIEWAQKVHENYTDTGAVWSDGQKHYQLVAGKITPVKDREMALGAAVGVSGGASANIPRLFYGNSTLYNLENVKQEGQASIDSDQCYIITGTVANIPIKYWISQKTLLIRQSQERIGSIPRLSVELSEEKIKKGLESAGQPATDEAVQQLKKTMESYQAAASKTKGSITETHRNIVINQPINFKPHISKYADMEISRSNSVSQTGK